MKTMSIALATLALLVVGIQVWAQRTTAPPPPMQTQRPPLEIEVESRYGFDETVEAVKKAAEEAKYPVQGVHEVSKIIASKGFPREALTIVEVCNAKMAAATLEQDVRAGLHMPCPVMVYAKGDKVFVTTFDTRTMATMYNGGDKMAAIGAEVYASLRKILDAVKK